MDIYKTQVEQTDFRKISRKNFEADTLERPPWYQVNKEGNKTEVTHFAICPSCDNPISIVGLIKSEKPYGRHHHQSVPTLAVLNVEEREFCPLYKPNRKRNSSDRKNNLSDTSRKIIQCMILKIDRIAYFLKKTIGIHFSDKFLMKMLEIYAIEQGYLYTGATLINVPWMLAYMMHSQTLYMQSISNEALLKAIRKHVPEAALIPEGKGRFRLDKNKEEGNKKTFLNLQICFIHHETQFKDHFIETMKMVVSRSVDQIIYQETITFDHDHFQRLSAMKTFTENDKQQALAKKILGSLLPD